MLAEQPEFASNTRMRELLRLTERRDLLQAGARDPPPATGSRSPSVRRTPTPGSPSSPWSLRPTRPASCRGVIGVMGPTRMPYDKIIGLVEHTSRMVEGLLE